MVGVQEAGLRDRMENPAWKHHSKQLKPLQGIPRHWVQPLVHAHLWKKHDFTKAFLYFFDSSLRVDSVS